MSDEIRRTEERLVYANPYVRVFDDSVRFPDGRAGTYVRIASATPGEGAVIIAHYRGRYALVRTWRYALGQAQLAFPRGFAHGTDVLQTARNELFEEVGATVTAAEVLGYVTPDSGLLAQRVAVVLVDIEDEPTGPHDSEVSNVTWVFPGRTDFLGR